MQDEIENSKMKDQEGGGMKKVDSAAEFGSECRSSVAGEMSRTSFGSFEDNNTVTNFLHHLIPTIGTGHQESIEVSKSLRQKDSHTRKFVEGVDSPAFDIVKAKDRRTYSLLVLELFADGKRRLKHMRVGDLVRYIQGVVREIQSTLTWEQDKVSSLFHHSCNSFFSIRN